MKRIDLTNKRAAITWIIIIAFVAFGQQLSAQKSRRGKTSTEQKIKSAEDFLRKYKNYEVVDSIQNKVGIHLNVAYFLQANYSNPMFDSEKDGKMCNEKLHLKDAETLEDIPANIGSVKAETKDTNGDVISIKYGSYFQISTMPKNTKFIIVCFDGISKTESEELETPPLFFLVQFDKKGIVVLTQKPQLLGDLFKSE